MWWIGIAILIGIIGLLSLFVRFTIVQEGTAKAVMKLGEFEKIIFQWRDHWMDNEWNIWREGEEGAPEKATKEVKIRGRIFGGFWYYGIWPVDKIHRYTLRWTDLHRISERERTIETVQFHEERLDHVFLRPIVYWTKIFGAETKPPERIPVDVEVLVTMRVFNPYRFLFIAPSTPIEDILARIDALLRDRIAQLTIDELLEVNTETLWKGWKIEREDKTIKIPGLKMEKLFKETLEKWGVRVAEKGVEIKRVDPPPRYSEALARRRELELESEAKKIALEIGAKARASEVMGTIIESVSIAEGRPKEEIGSEIRKDPEGFYKKHKTIVDSVITKLAMEAGAYLKIETAGGEGGLLSDLLKLIVAWQRMPRGESEKKRKEKRSEYLEKEEAFELQRKWREERLVINFQGLEF